MAAGKRLTTTVIVSAPAGSGQSFAIFGPDDDVPDWAGDQIGDHCYGEPDDALPPINDTVTGEQFEDDEATPAPSKRTTAKK